MNALRKPQTRVFQKDDILVKKDDKSGILYMIKNGRVKVYDKTTDGDTIEIAQLGPGQLVGELAMLDGRANRLFVKAVIPTEVYVFDKNEFKHIIKDSHPLVQTLIKILATRLQETDETLLIAKGQYLLLNDEIEEMSETE